MTVALADLSERELLDEVEVLRRTQLETGVALLRLVSESPGSTVRAPSIRSRHAVRVVSGRSNRPGAAS